MSTRDDSEDGRSARRVGDSAVVVGASMAGLCAARVLAERFEHVLVVDRDALPDGATPRARVPQGRHPHLLLAAGARLLEGWFPGIVAELEAAGATSIDICRDVRWHQSGGVQRRPASSLRGPAMSRPLLERTVRGRLEAWSNVSIRSETAVDGLRTDDSRSRVTEVVLDDGRTVACDLVVDATGRPARSLAWVTAMGYDPPATSVVEVDTRYVTRVHRRGDLPRRDWQAAAVVGDPATKRLAMVLPLEGDRWFVMLGGVNGEAAPTDPAGMLAYARSLDSPVIADVLEACEPLGEAVTHRFPANQRRHVERLRRFPLGWVLLGDAVCSFDPIYGQGMTSAAMQADALGRRLDRHRTVDRSFARAYFRDAGRVVAVPWSIAVGGDFAYDGTIGEKPAGTDLVNRYMERVAVAAQHDDRVVLRLNEVVSLVRRPTALLTPAFVLRVLRGARRGPLALSSARVTPDDRTAVECSPGGS